MNKFLLKVQAIRDSELGDLGWRLHFRCRDCGMDYSVNTKEKDEKPNAEVDGRT